MRAQEFLKEESELDQLSKGQPVPGPDAIKPGSYQDVKKLITLAKDWYAKGYSREQIQSHLKNNKVNDPMIKQVMQGLGFYGTVTGPLSRTVKGMTSALAPYSGAVKGYAQTPQVSRPQPTEPLKGPIVR